MDSLSYKTISANAATTTKEWYVIDATHADCGDYVIVINADKVKLTGKKMDEKEYVRYTGYPGGQRFATPADFLKRKPAFVIEHAVKGMLPKTRLGEAIIKNLKVYAGAEHPHAAQSPKAIKLNEIK